MEPRGNSARSREGLEAGLATSIEVLSFTGVKSVEFVIIFFRVVQPVWIVYVGAEIVVVVVPERIERTTPFVVNVMLPQKLGEFAGIIVRIDFRNFGVGLKFPLVQHFQQCRSFLRQRLCEVAAFFNIRNKVVEFDVVVAVELHELPVAHPQRRTRRTALVP